MDPLGEKTGQYGGSIREAGGAFGALAAARENEYFRQQDEQKLKDLKKSLDENKVKQKEKKQDEKK